MTAVNLLSNYVETGRRELARASALALSAADAAGFVALTIFLVARDMIESVLSAGRDSAVPATRPAFAVSIIPPALPEVRVSAAGFRSGADTI